VLSNMTEPPLGGGAGELCVKSCRPKAGVNVERSPRRPHTPIHCQARPLIQYSPSMSQSFPPAHRLSHIERLVDVIDLPIGRWDAQARLVFCNEPYIGWAERPREELIGRTLQEIYGDDAWARAEPAFREAFEGRTVNYERRLTHGHKAARWARVQVFPDVDARGKVEAVFTIAFDIHEDVLARESLEAARERLDRFTENIPYPLTYVDRGFVLRFVNKAYCEATGHRPDEMLGRHIGDVRGARRWSEHAPFFERALKGQTVQYTRLVDRLPQGPRWLRTSYVPTDGTDCSVHIETSARGFAPIWTAVVRDFHARHPLAGVRICINDMGATPAVVSLRLEQAVSELKP